MNKELKSRQIFGLMMVILLLITSCVIFGISLAYGFLAGIVICCVVFIGMGYSARELASVVKKGLMECRTLYILILLIGATVSVWLASGVVPAMMYYGFEYMKGMNFLFVAFVIMTVSAIFMGTAVGTVSTVGIAILGIGTGFGMPRDVLLGVIVSGAFVADKISPISGLLNLTLSTTGTRYRSTLWTMLSTLLPTLVVTGIAYFLLGIRYSGAVTAATITEYQASIASVYHVSPFLLLLPVFIVAMSCAGVKTVYSILTGLLGGSVISLMLQKVQIPSLLKAICFGYHGSTGSARLDHILVSGGVVSMLEVLAIVMGAIALSSILEGTGIIGILTNSVIAGIMGKKELLLKTGLISSALTVVTCDQTMGIVLPGRLLSRKYDEMGVDRTVLARTISDTGTIIAPLMPWNVNALIIGIVAGTTSGYAPFAVLCYAAPVMTLIAAFVGSRKRYHNNN